MADRIEIKEEQMECVSGGAITYTWDGNQGTLGMDGVNKYVLLNKDDFLVVYNEMFGTYSDADIIRTLREKGIIQKP